jgi:hypothetical protein
VHESCVEVMQSEKLAGIQKYSATLGWWTW